jgi:UDP-hydrolysing UDP-N-acetyl-D-glucosamine 2-epimerase
MKRVVCVISARPSYARIKTALDSLMARNVDVDVVCIASALLERYGAVEKQIKQDGFVVDWVSHCQIEGDDPVVQARTMALATLDLSTYFAMVRPDAVMTIADRYETLATAVAASYQNIPLIHVQGGEVTGSIDDKVRHAITQLADLHLVSCEDAGRRVLQMKPDAEVVVTGCPSLDLAVTVDSTPLAYLPGVGPQLELGERFVLVLQHPVTDEAEKAARQAREIQRAVEQVGLPAVWFWPNVDSGSERLSKALRTWTPKVPVHFVRQVPPSDFIRLMRQCAVMVGNSSAGIREGAILGTPVVNIGSRQRGRARGRNVIDVPSEALAIVRAIHQWQTQERPEPSNLYGDGTGGLRVADAVVSWLTGRQIARHVA